MDTFSKLDQASLDKEVLDDFATLSQFGATPGGGVDREALSRSDADQRRWLAEWLSERGFEVTFDRIGNQFGTYTFTPGAPYVLLGSHLDSQPLGGKFDGAYGVLAAAEAAWRIARKYQESGFVPRYNLAVVNWFNEEGSRFQPSMMGSAVYTGKLDVETALDTTDLSGIKVSEALEVAGCLGSGKGPEAAAYGEIHIEQGRILDNSGDRIGVVEGTWAAQKYHLVVHGEQSHTGSTIIPDRRDALLGASHLVVAARQLTEELGSDLHTSVGQMVILPNSPVVVAREVGLHLDLRSADVDVLKKANERLTEHIREIERLANVVIEKESSYSWGLLPYDARGVLLARGSANELDLSSRDMMTIAGHDSTNLKDIVPTVMLFVPSVDGISHNEGEYTAPDDICSGVDLFTHVAERLLDGELQS